ncbi:MAG: glycosyl transferase family 2 [Bryobacterales bacterium]|nr:glycosyl transferase family 2 [Bryobacterales bacterium]
MNPPLCVLIPVFNGQAGLVRTLRSLAVAASSFDVLVVDDGSDPPVMIEAGIAGPHRVILIRLDNNGGITRALNHGLQRVYDGQYRFIGRVDAGDTVHPDRFVKQVQHLDREPDCGLVGSLIGFVDMNGATLFVFQAPESHRRIAKRMQVENCVIHSGVAMRTEVVRKAGGYYAECLASEDYDLFRRMIRISEATILPEVLTRCEYNLAGISVSRRGRQQRERLNLQLKYFQRDDWMSYYGVARTCVAMLTPHRAVLAVKRVGLCIGKPRLENPLVG